jgi:hypothetical protein
MSIERHLINGGAAMAPKTSKPDVSPGDWEDQSSADQPVRTWVWWLRFLLLILFVVLLFLLGQAMVRHHFFTGGAQNYGNHPGGP